MKLADWFSQTKPKPRREDFARRIGVANSACVTRYLNGTRLPAPAVMMRIAEATNGAVTPNDFLLPPPKARRRNGAPREAAE